ncbi:MAG TPA: RsmE family RNA methyltransferase [Gemmatimonadales bacterium]|nr:RsmE family RNA methyltransferase [Gemmatimonadales bacterium]
MIHVIVTPGSLVAGESLLLDEDESHHLDVRRVSVGSEARAIDGIGTAARGILRNLTGRWEFEVSAVGTMPMPPAITLAVAAADRDRFLLVVEKSAELGVSRIIPLETRHTASVSTRLREAALDKARRRVREACKQSGNAWFPVIDPITRIDALDSSIRWFLADPWGERIPDLGESPAVGWLIGPEAGFTPDERTGLVERLGAVPVALGSHVLRFETAAIVAAALTNFCRLQSSGE